LSLKAITVDPENNRRKGFAKVPGTKNGAPDIDGPRARMATVLTLLPPMINPPIITLSPVSVRARVEMLISFDGLAPPSTSKASINPIPLVPPTPLWIAV
jgi:hypothetical protein